MRTETKWALIAVLLLAIWLCVQNFLGLHSAEKFATGMLVDFIVSILIFIFVYFMATREKREAEYNGVMSWSEGFWAAARMTLVFLPLSTLVIYLYLQYINPAFPAIFNEKSGADSYHKDPVNVYLQTHVISAFLFGGLFCLIFPLFTRKNA